MQRRAGVDVLVSFRARYPGDRCWCRKWQPPEGSTCVFGGASPVYRCMRCGGGVSAFTRAAKVYHTSEFQLYIFVHIRLRVCTVCVCVCMHYDSNIL